MSKVEIKEEINKTIDGLQDDLPVHLQEVERMLSSTINLVTNFRKILTEDRNLRHRLAQYYSLSFA